MTEADRQRFAAIGGYDQHRKNASPPAELQGRVVKAMALPSLVNGLTQVERDRVIHWLMENRPTALREALRALGYVPRTS